MGTLVGDIKRKRDEGNHVLISSDDKLQKTRERFAVTLTHLSGSFVLSRLPRRVIFEEKIYQEEAEGKLFLKRRVQNMKGL